MSARAGKGQSLKLPNILHRGCLLLFHWIFIPRAQRPATAYLELLRIDAFGKGPAAAARRCFGPSLAWRPSVTVRGQCPALVKPARRWSGRIERHLAMELLEPLCCALAGKQGYRATIVETSPSSVHIASGREQPSDAGSGLLSFLRGY